MDWQLIRQPLGTSGLKEGAARVKSRARERKVRPITNIANTALRKEEMAVSL
jgi:hypothetical protein